MATGILRSAMQPLGLAANDLFPLLRSGRNDHLPSTRCLG
ncbi:MAG: hypothetical protein AVDCRST_MAG43-2079 [uncultured Thermomicrobiales bacterium]|uniref:Uncharacterized protein n=1 Tax=uncultured Thermomicrobiales bacterium TaxID=1645740 RepID=A0A6J4UX74_9BACT|nr:MAG: hypothetical protein AVDCRST_MAG43-2079 [uncultured Thermomicrobiales bacterium]